MQAAAWRRLALPAGASLLVLCVAGAAVANGGALKQAASAFVGGAGPTATQTSTSAASFQPTGAGPTVAPVTSLPAPATPAQAIVPSATATTTPQATLTPAPTATSLPSVSPTVSLPPDVIGVATVVLPQGAVGRLRDAPNGQVIADVPGNTVVNVLSGRQTASDNIVWVHLRLPNTGQTGWFSESLL